MKQVLNLRTEDSHLRTRRRENLRSYFKQIFSNDKTKNTVSLNLSFIAVEDTQISVLTLDLV
jgi:hypothetical protein